MHADQAMEFEMGYELPEEEEVHVEQGIEHVKLYVSKVMKCFIDSYMSIDGDRPMERQSIVGRSSED